MTTQSGKFVFASRNVTIRTDFENGHLASVEEAEEDVFDIFPYSPSQYAGGGIELESLLESGQTQPANFAFHFRVEGARGRELAFRFHLLERQKPDGGSVVYANPAFPVFSYDGRDWRTVERKTCEPSPADGPGWQVVTAWQYFTGPEVHVAYQYPYTITKLTRFARQAQGSPLCRVGVAGCSAEGRLIPMLDVTDPAVPLNEKKVACFTGLQHSAELCAGWAHETMAEFLLSEDPVAQEARRRWLFRFIPIVNVDAVAEGAGRIHSSGRNLNREWQRPDPAPEIGSIQTTFRSWVAAGSHIDLFIDVHGFAGLGQRWAFFLQADETLPPEMAREQSRLMQLLKSQVPGTRWVLDDGNPTEAGMFFLREFGALSMSVDGWCYPFNTVKDAPDLASHYRGGRTVTPLDEIRAAAAGWVRAFNEFGR